MPVYKHKWLLECANAFGMNVSEFAECIGYSRQALYQANEGLTRLDLGRLALAQYKLEVVSEKMFYEEQARAKENFEKRNRLLDSLLERLSDWKENDHA